MAESVIAEPREKHKVQLAAEILRAHGHLRLTAMGASMLPALWPGDELTIEALAGQDAVPGDIVLLMRNGRFVVHRLIARGYGSEERWLTRGDCLAENDVSATRDQLLGRVLEVRRGPRRFVPARQVSLQNRCCAWLLCHCDLLRSLGLRAHAAWRDGMKSSDRGDTALRASTRAAWPGLGK